MTMYDNSDLGSKRTSQKAEGVMVAVVTNNKDPEGLGRVKLKLPLRETETETDWTRIATLMAGSDRGTYFVPEVGDEVLVAFHLGEIRHPYVIGMLWNPQQKAPQGNEDNYIRKIRSKSGHEFTFSDDPDAAMVNILTAKGHTIEFDDKADKISISTPQGTNTILIEGGNANQITVKSQSAKITISGQGQIVVDAPASVTLKAPEVKVEATANLSLKGGTAVNINSDGIVNIKGNLVKIN